MKIGIIGSGKFGTSLAFNFSKNFKKVYLWNRTQTNKNELVEKINNLNKGILIKKLNPNLKIIKSLKKVAENSDVILLCINAQSMFDFLAKNFNSLKNKPLVFCSKGIDTKYCLFQTEIAERFLDKKLFSVLSGPGFASDIVKEKPIALSLACKNVNLGKKLQHMLSSQSIRIYLNNDLIGTQLGGALKNVIAIACGIADANELGEGARSAIITRGFSEIRQIGKTFGCKIETLFGLSCLGDLTLTCNSKLSRNYNFGLKIGNNVKIKKDNKETVEGEKTANAAFLISKKYQLDLPIIKTVNKLIIEDIDTKEAIKKLLERPLKKEY